MKGDMHSNNLTYLSLVRHFYQVVYSSSHGKLLLTIWGSYLLLLLSLKKSKRTSPAPVETEAFGNDKQKHDNKGGEPLLKLIKILIRHSSAVDVMTLVMYVLSLSSRIFITVKLADISGELASYMGARKYSKMFSGQAWFGLFCLLASGCTAAMKFLEKQCELCARSILFVHMKDRYLDEDYISYYHQGLPDAPARLSSDLQEFSGTLVHSLGHFLKPLIDIVHLSVVMTKRIDWSIKRFRDRALPKSIKELTVDRQHFESKLRDNLTRVHHYREQIAMQKGTTQENSSVTATFEQYQKLTEYELFLLFLVDCVKNYTIKYGGLMCAFSILTPSSYLDPSKTAEDITAAFMANSSLLGSLASAVKDMADSMTQLPRLQGYAERVFELEASIDRTRSQNIPFNTACREVSEDLRLSGISIMSPARSGVSQTLVKNLDMKVIEEEHTVIRGPNGIGKSSIFRTLAGLWPAKKEEESATLKVPQSCFIVPQDTYFPNDKSLKAQITYPKDPELLSDNKAYELLNEVGLQDIASRFDVHDIKDWANVLSGGQKQRLSWARLFFHSPKYALLDEATSAISVDMVDSLFTSAKMRHITLLTISHSLQVDSHHKRALDIKDKGKYEIKELV